MFKNILVPTDGSPLSRKAIQRAVQLAAEQKARITGVHVELPYSPGVLDESTTYTYISPKEHAARVKEMARKHLAVVEKAAAEAQVPCRTVVAQSRYPFDGIVRTAQRMKCDLICMASHGRRGVSRMILGSETSKVLAHSKVPVLVVR